MDKKTASSKFNIQINFLYTRCPNKHGKFSDEFDIVFINNSLI